VNPSRPGEGPIGEAELARDWRCKPLLAVVSGEAPDVPCEIRFKTMEFRHEINWLGSSPHFFMPNLLQDPAAIEPIREYLMEWDTPIIVCAEIVPRAWLNVEVEE
jgi:hypothetical protein